MLLLVLLAALLADRPLAAQAQKPTRPFGLLTQEWTRTLDAAERYLKGSAQTEEQSTEFRGQVKAVHDAATLERDQARRQVESTTRLLEALGPPPAEGQPAEAEAVAGQRAQFNEDIAFYKGRVAQAELAIARAAEIDQRISVLTRERLVERLLDRAPAPIAPATLRAAVPEAARLAVQLARAPLAWYAGLSDADRGRLGLAELTLFALGAVLVAWLVRRLLRERFGRDSALAAPSYGRRFAAALVDALARTLVPAAALGGVWLTARAIGPGLTGITERLAAAAVFALLVFVVAAALARGSLAGAAPDWRLVPIVRDRVRQVGHWVAALAAVFAADLFVTAALREAQASAALGSAYGLLAAALLSAGVLVLTQGRLWDSAALPAAMREPDEEAPQRDTKGESVSRAWVWVRRLGAGLAVIGLAAALLDPVIVIAWLVLIMPVWGVPQADLCAWTLAALRGFTVGGVTISFADIGFAILVFLALVLLARLAQRGLADHVLPETNLDPSVRHSLVAGAGYVGVLIAAATGIAVLGIGLTNIALVAGALSVGIGFGLQNIVNNFVSGLILLVERPIKVGDWVVVGGHEGFVRRISVRASELETFERASVLIPNAEIIQNAVLNWPHKDPVGRVDVGVGVAYGSDTDKVRAILLAVALNHPRTLPVPEPFVLFRDFGASSLDFELRCFTNEVILRAHTASDLRYAIERRFREEGIEIPFPQRVVRMAPAGAD
ncbi:MAG: mechanosensitive ion channel family protein [Alphaproteobacteria bacterium]|nr:mechanosensitive ion channel family protein [Alphaproteobacteria bacterium]